LRRSAESGSLGVLEKPIFKEKTMSDMTTVTKDKLIADVKVVIADAEELLRATAGQAGDKIVEARAKVQDHLNNAKASLADAQAAVVDRAKAVGHATDDYVHDNPWRSVGVAAGIGFIVGLLIGRR
jgi:ElaB/YqjD/DUF883 family membrane-anchored ribosome-binding protein